MKFISSLTICLIVATLINNSQSLPAKKRVVYFKPAAKLYSGPKHMMFMRYVQPAGSYARFTQAAALTADENIDADADTPVVFDTPQITNDVVAEGQNVEVDASDAILPVVYPNEEQIPADEPSIVLPLPENPEKRFLPETNDNENKVIIELDAPTDNEIVDEEQDTVVAVPQGAVNDEDDFPILPVPKYPARVPYIPRPAVKKQVKQRQSGTPKPLPTGTFFPVDFGGVQGGAIALAHSLSTDAGGSATSNAIAYGTPSAAVESARLRARRH